MHLQATDGEIGHVDDLLIDVDSWNAPYLLIDTSNWIGGRSVLVPTSAITAVDWVARRVNVNLPKARIELAPTPDLGGPVDRATQTTLDTYYGRNVPPQGSQTRAASRKS